MKPSTTFVLVVAALVRLALLGYGEWQDENFVVKYTDIDYKVFSDGAKHVVEGNSPYDRHTYRYTPLLAFIIVPSVVFHSALGKLMFCCADLAIGWLLVKILVARGISKQRAVLYSCAWLFNPISINISTRGNCDSLISLLVIATLYLLMKQRIKLAAVLYGLAVHFRVYPIIYALPLTLFINGRMTTKAPKKSVVNLFGLITPERALFAGLSAGTFFLLLASFYALYGWEFLYETYLYHFVRTDNRHNFSFYFYQLYLQHGSKGGFLVGLSAFLPQMLTVATFGIKFHEDLPLALFLQTVAFVAFNKVMTAQYFLWYLPFIPLLIPFSHMSLVQWLSVAVVFFGTEGFWLYNGYLLEFKGQDTFFHLWVAGLVFLGGHVYMLLMVIRNHRFQPLFNQGKLTAKAE